MRQEQRTIDLDQNATTPLDPAVCELMRPYWLLGGNAESRHSLGREMRLAVDWSRETIARILNCNVDEVVFTSGGTESNNMAIFGLAMGQGLQTPGRIVSSTIEHPAVSEPLVELEKRGWRVERAGVDAEGVVDPVSQASMLDLQTCLATLMLANNETGAIQSVREVASAAARLGVPLHTDAVQAVGRIPVDFRNLGVTTLAASAHKFHGPAGVGILLVKRGAKLTPLLHGGSQQEARRPGTVPVALVVGCATALERWEFESNDRIARMTGLRDRLETGLRTRLGEQNVVRNGPSHDDLRLPQTLNLAFPGVQGDVLLVALDLQGVAASLGSACASGATKPSPTLLAMGLPSDRLQSSIRFSFGAQTTEEEIDQAIECTVAAVNRQLELLE